jgi:hypothetical protein
MLALSHCTDLLASTRLHPLPADTLYLFGKVASSSSTPSKSPGSSSSATTWQSCCVVVPNLHRSVLFVPSPSVFDDASGELAALEAAVAADPSKKMELLQVRLRAARRAARATDPCAPHVM